MKKIIVLLAVMLVLTGCQKTEIESSADANIEELREKLETLGFKHDMNTALADSEAPMRALNRTEK